MRRIVQTFAVLSVLALGACGGGGGSVLNFDNNNTNVDRVIVTTVGPSNVARVLPGAVLPLSATAVRGSQNGYVQVNSFRWSAALTTGLQYPANELGQMKPCANVTFTPTGGTAAPYTADFSLYLTIDPVNEANVEFIPPTIIPNPNPAGGVLTTNFPYCVIISATPRGGNASNTGSIVVAVVNPAAPTQ